VLVGPMPTPAVAFLTRALRLSAGVMISASHNPFEDNGIKFFSADGMKLPDAAEHEIETMLAPEGKLDLSGGEEHAETISTRLMAFPHMFPPATNQWTAGADRDPATDTFASPDVWTNFANFYQRAAEASKLAFDASRKKRGNEFKLLISQLRTACNGCHASFMKSE